MKRVLIISEPDMAGLRLTELFNSLFTNEEKQLYYCTIDIVDCQHRVGTFSVNKTMNIAKIPSVFPKYVTPYKTLHAISCHEINAMIKEHKINVVLTPIFIYDKQRFAQYDQIVKAIKRVSHVDILGLYI